MSSVSLPKTMKAWLVTGLGSPKDALEFKPDWPVPAAPTGNNIMVRVSHASLNPLDLELMTSRIPFRRPALAAVDFVGEVVQAGPAVCGDIEVGMMVCGTVPTSLILRGHGTLAEYIVVPDHAAAKKPVGLGDAAAVGLMGVAGQTATVLLGTKLNPGDRILVNGASGGVGSLLVQVLSAQGYHVTGICSKKNESLVLNLGAKEVVDYTASGLLYDHLALRAASNPFDVVMDCLGHEELYKHSPRYLKVGGDYINIAGSLMPFIKAKMCPVILGGTPRNYVRLNNSPAGSRAKEASNWFKSGWIKEVPIDEIFDMEHALEGYEKLATKHARGKIVVKVAL